MKTPDTRWGRTLLIVSVVIGSACLVGALIREMYRILLVP